MYKNKSILAVVTARLKSKRIKNKNIIKIRKNKCLLDWTYEAGKKSKLIDRLVLSTESKKVSLIARKIGFEVPFKAEKFSSDHIEAAAPVKHMIKKLKSNMTIFYFYNQPLL